jgi:hypothetical protein
MTISDKGVCYRGNTCPFDHGTDFIEDHGNGNNTMHNMSPLSHAPGTQVIMPMFAQQQQQQQPRMMPPTLSHASYFPPIPFPNVTLQQVTTHSSKSFSNVQI